MSWSALRLLLLAAAMMLLLSTANESPGDATAPAKKIAFLFLTRYATPPQPSCLASKLTSPLL